MNEVAKNGNAEAKVLRRARFAENRGRVQRLKDELKSGGAGRESRLW